MDVFNYNIYLALKFISYSVKDRQKQKQAKTKYHI